MSILVGVGLSVFVLGFSILPLASAGALEILVGAGAAHESGRDFGVVHAPVWLGQFEKFEVANESIWLLVDAPTQGLSILSLLLSLDLLLFEVLDELRIVDLVILLHNGLFFPGG